MGPGRPAAPPPQQQRPTYPPLRQRRRGRPARPPPRPRARRASAASTRSPGAPPRPPEVLDISSVLDASHSTSWSPGHPGGPSCSLARMASTRARGPPSQSSSSFGPPRACLPSFRGRRAPGACCRRRPSRDGVCLSSRFFLSGIQSCWDPIRVEGGFLSKDFDRGLGRGPRVGSQRRSTEKRISSPPFVFKIFFESYKYRAARPHGPI